MFAMQKEIKSGIKRQKEHLIGGYADVQKCSKTTTTIANEILKWHTQAKKRKVKDIEGDELQSLGFIGSNNPPTSTASQQTKKASAPARVKVVGKKVRPLDVLWRGPLHFCGERRQRKVDKQTVIEDHFKKQEKAIIDNIFCDMLYECSLPFNLVNKLTVEFFVRLLGIIERI